MSAIRVKLAVIGILLIVLSACKPAGGGPPPGAAVPVIVAAAEVDVARDKISVVGSVMGDELVEIQSEIDGIVEEIGFVEGQSVKKGHLLFKIDEEKLQARVEEAEANFNLASANIKRSEALLKNKTISSKEYDQALAVFLATKASLERAKRELADARMTAPIDGQMGTRMVSPGQFVSRGQTISSVVNQGIVKAEFNVPERYVSKLSLGMKVNVEVDGYPKEKFVGKVFFVSPRVDTRTRTVLVKAAVPNNEGKLLAGMLAKVDAIFEEREHAVFVAESSLVLQKDGVYLFVVGDENKVELRQVKSGERVKKRIEITEGLSAGELVVVEGIQKLRPGALVSFKNPNDSAGA